MMEVTSLHVHFVRSDYLLYIIAREEGLHCLLAVHVGRASLRIVHKTTRFTAEVLLEIR